MAPTVGKAGDVPAGSIVAFQVEGKQVAVANVDGRLFAFDDACTHRGCSLATGSLKGTSVTCPCHGSVFEATDGSVIKGPASRPVATSDVEIVDGEIAISGGTASTAGDGGSATTTAAPPPAPAPQGRAAGSPTAADHERTRAALASVPLFADLDGASLDGLEAFTFRKLFAAGALIVEEGRTGNGLYVVLSGSVEVVRGATGSQPQRLAILGPGEPFGEMALLGDWKRSASVRAIDEVECMGMDRWAFLSHLRTEPGLAIRMVQVLAARLAKADADADEAGDFVVREPLRQESEPSH
jgi:3-phenylpropionate/trans-cinnamate dioxygenase ferredoxin subunit